MQKPEPGQPVSIAKVKVIESVPVLDLRSVVWGEDPAQQWVLRNVVDNRFISEPTSDVEDTRPEYRVPQFIADLARKRRLRGILYDSTRPSAYNNPEAVGYNLVVFDPFPDHVIEENTVVAFDEPDYDPFSSEVWKLLHLHTRGTHSFEPRE
jgi:RES domain